jgi:predicted component of type VI protein secretion system
VILDKGRVTEQGTHDELVALGGIYATFVREQRCAEQLEALQHLDAQALQQGAAAPPPSVENALSAVGEVV